MAELRVAGGRRIAGIQVGSGVVGGKQDQALQEVDDRFLERGRQRLEPLARPERLTTVPQDHLAEVDAATVVAVGRRAPDPP